MAWCEEENTKFSRYFAEALGQRPPINISLVDEFINMRLEAEDDPSTGGEGTAKIDKSFKQK